MVFTRHVQVMYKIKMYCAKKAEPETLRSKRVHGRAQGSIFFVLFDINTFFEACKRKFQVLCHRNQDINLINLPPQTGKHFILGKPTHM